MKRLSEPEDDETDAARLNDHTQVQPQPKDEFDGKDF
jgi:hypothetical protein